MLTALMELRAEPHNQTIWADRDSTRRIVQRFINKGWWFAHEVDHSMVDGMRHRLTFAETIHLENEVRKGMPGLKFTVRQQEG